MRLFTSTLCTTVAVGLLAGCSINPASTTSSVPATAGAEVHLRSAGNASPVSRVPRWLIGNTQFHGRKAKGLVSRGMYISGFAASFVNGFKRRNLHNIGLYCRINSVNSVSGLAADDAKNLIEPDGGSYTVNIYSSQPRMCGPRLRSISDPYGQPADASSANAVTGRIAVLNVVSKSLGPGSISICTMTGGCTVNLTDPSILFYGGGLAMDNFGNCWVTSENSSFSLSAMTYFAGCAMPGQAVTGFQNISYGGLEIDKAGNILSIDFRGSANGQLWVYSGCKPACTLVGGPYQMNGRAFSGRLNKATSLFASVEIANGYVDIYDYSPTAGLTYLYSFYSGFDKSLFPSGIAWAPRSQQ